MLMNTYIATGEGANRYEKIPVQIYEEPATAVVTVAKEIANLIRSKAEKNEKCVLGLATGSSPIKLYEELVRMHKEEGLSFQNVITFNLENICRCLKNLNKVITTSCTTIYSTT